MVISAAISKHIYISINRTFTDDYFLKYSPARAGRRADRHRAPDRPRGAAGPRRRPRRRDRQHRRHPLRHRPGLLRVVHRRAAQGRARHAAQPRRRPPTWPRRPARSRSSGWAAPVGKQDQYIAAFGGITRVRLQPGRLGRRRAGPAVARDTVHDLEQHLLMFFTGYSRAADEVLAEQVTKSTGRRPGDDRQPALRQGARAAQLERPRAGRRRRLRRPHARALGEQEEALELDVQPAHRPLYDVGRDNGARGGKLVGAGAGGFLMFYAEDTRRVRAAMRERGAGRAAVRLRPRRQHHARPRVRRRPCSA